MTTDTAMPGRLGRPGPSAAHRAPPPMRDCRVPRFDQPKAYGLHGVVALRPECLARPRLVVHGREDLEHLAEELGLGASRQLRPPLLILVHTGDRCLQTLLDGRGWRCDLERGRHSRRAVRHRRIDGGTARQTACRLEDGTRSGLGDRSHRARSAACGGAAKATEHSCGGARLKQQCTALPTRVRRRGALDAL
jgi:hypothetical protein